MSSTQDATRVAPNIYKVLFENDEVRAILVELKKQ